MKKVCSEMKLVMLIESVEKGGKTESERTRCALSLCMLKNLQLNQYIEILVVVDVIILRKWKQTQTTVSLFKKNKQTNTNTVFGYCLLQLLMA